MKPGDLAIIMCSRVDRINGKVVLLLEWQKPASAFQASRWLCLVDGSALSINSGWLKVIK